MKKIKKICWTLRLMASSVLIWQTISLYLKDENFKKDLDEAKSLNKFNVWFKHIVGLNKNFFSWLKSFDYQWNYDKIKWKFEQNIEELNWKLDELKENMQNMSDEKIQPILEDVLDRVNNFKNKAKYEVANLNERYNLEEKFDWIKDKVNELKKNTKK